MAKDSNIELNEEQVNEEGLPQEKHDQAFKEKALEIGVWRIEQAAKTRRLPTQREIAKEFKISIRQAARYVRFLANWTNFNEELKSMLASALMMFITRAALKGNGNDFKIIFQIVEKFDFSTTIRTPDMGSGGNQPILPAFIAANPAFIAAERAAWEAEYRRKSELSAKESSGEAVEEAVSESAPPALHKNALDLLSGCMNGQNGKQNGHSGNNNGSTGE